MSGEKIKNENLKKVYEFFKKIGIYIQKEKCDKIVLPETWTHSVLLQIIVEALNAEEFRLRIFVKYDCLIKAQNLIEGYTKECENYYIYENAVKFCPDPCLTFGCIGKFVKKFIEQYRENVKYQKFELSNALYCEIFNEEAAPIDYVKFTIIIRIGDIIEIEFLYEEFPEFLYKRNASFKVNLKEILVLMYREAYYSLYSSFSLYS
jgi:hypothetical protein